MLDQPQARTPRQHMAADLRRWTIANLRYLADLFLPPVCIRCHEPVASHGVLCAPCWQRIDFITPPVCDRLGWPLPFAAGEERPLSAMALQSPPLYDRARAVARFDGTMRDLVHGLKYADRHESAGMLAGLLHAAGGELLAGTDLMLPIPLHRSRLLQRRFNQTALLAHRLSAASGVPAHMTLLRRIRPTVSQVGLSREDRRSNVASAFALAPRAAAAIAGKRLLLIDDVITTGATLEACAQVLKAAGAAEVNCLALAIALGEDDPHLT